MDTNHHNDVSKSSRNEHEPHCASEKLFRKLKKENNLLKELNSKSRSTNENNVKEKSDINLNKLKHNDGVTSSKLSDNHKDFVKRFKRWVSDEEVRLLFFKLDFSDSRPL